MNVNSIGKSIETRVYPDFIVVGAQRSGTTSLFQLLSGHDAFVASSPKEVHYFDGGLNPDIDHYQLGDSWYRSHFPTMENAVGKKVFEATPLYLFNPLSAQRIYETVPDVKIVVLLRNPTDRAISNYFLEKKLGREKRPILDAMMEEDEVTANVWHVRDYKSDEFIHCTYKRRGRYQEQLKRYLTLFPRESVFIIQSEKLFSDPKMVLSELFLFLGVGERFTVSTIDRKNAIAKSTSVDESVYQYLNEYFRPYNEQLYQYIGMNFSW